MKINTFKQYKFTAELWNYTITRDSTGGELKHYFLARGVRVNASTTGQGRLFIFFPATDDDIDTGSRLHVFRDTSGKLIVNGGVFEITSVEPILNIWGFAEGFKAKAELLGLDGAVDVGGSSSTGNSSTGTTPGQVITPGLP